MRNMFMTFLYLVVVVLLCTAIAAFMHGKVDAGFVFWGAATSAVVGIFWINRKEDKTND